LFLTLSQSLSAPLFRLAAEKEMGLELVELLGLEEAELLSCPE